MRRHGMLQPDARRHFDAPVVKRKFAFCRMVRQETDVRLMRGHRLNQFVTLREGVNRISAEIECRALGCDDISQVRDIGWRDVGINIACRRFRVNGIDCEVSAYRHGVSCADFGDVVCIDSRLFQNLSNALFGPNKLRSRRGFPDALNRFGTGVIPVRVRQQHKIGWQIRLIKRWCWVNKPVCGPFPRKIWVDLDNCASRILYRETALFKPVNSDSILWHF